MSFGPRDGAARRERSRPPRVNSLSRIRERTHPRDAMRGCSSGPGSSLHDDARGMAGIVESAKRDAEALQAGGIIAVMFGNEGDRPYRTKVGPETVAAVAAAVAAVAAAAVVAAAGTETATEAGQYKEQLLTAIQAG